MAFGNRKRFRGASVGNPSLDYSDEVDPDVFEFYQLKLDELYGGDANNDLQVYSRMVLNGGAVTPVAGYVVGTWRLEPYVAYEALAAGDAVALAWDAGSSSLRVAKAACNLYGGRFLGFAYAAAAAAGLAVLVVVGGAAAVCLREAGEDAWAAADFGTLAYLSDTAGRLTKTPTAVAGEYVSSVGFITADQRVKIRPGIPTVVPA